MDFKNFRKAAGYDVPSKWVALQKQNYRNRKRCREWKRFHNQPKGLSDEMVEVLLTLDKRSIKFMNDHIEKYKHYFT